MEIKKIGDECVIYSFFCGIDELKKHLSDNYEKIKTTITFKGFRKGHVPLKIFQKFFNTDLLYNKVIESLINEKYLAILKDLTFEFIGEPELIDVKPKIIDFNKPFLFSLKFYLKMKIQLCQYKGLIIYQNKLNISEIDIQDKINDLLDKKIIYQNKISNSFLELKDIAVCDFEGFIDGKAFENNKAKDFYLEIGSNTFIPGFEKAMLGMKIGETKQIDIVFPANYYIPNLSNKKTIFNVFLKFIKQKNNNVLNNEIIKYLKTSGINGIEELKSNIKQQIEFEYKLKNKQYIKDQILDQILKNSHIDISKDFLNKLKIEEIENLKQELKQKQITLDQYLVSLNLSLKELEQNIINQLSHKLKLEFLLREIIDQEKIVVSEEEIQTIYQKINYNYSNKINSKNKNYSLDQVKNYLLEEKVFDFIIKESIIKDNA